MKFNRFLRTIKSTPLHSSGLSGGDGVVRTHSNAREPFERRMRIDDNRRHVKRYPDGAIVQQQRGAGDKSSKITTVNTATDSGQTNTSRQKKQAHNASPPVRVAKPEPHRFTEPPSRYRP